MRSFSRLVPALAGLVLLAGCGQLAPSQEVFQGDAPVLASARVVGQAFDGAIAQQLLARYGHSTRVLKLDVDPAGDANTVGFTATVSYRHFWSDTGTVTLHDDVAGTFDLQSMKVVALRVIRGGY